MTGIQVGTCPSSTNVVYSRQVTVPLWSDDLRATSTPLSARRTSLRRAQAATSLARSNECWRIILTRRHPAWRPLLALQPLERAPARPLNMAGRLRQSFESRDISTCRRPSVLVLGACVSRSTRGPALTVSTDGGSVTRVSPATNGLTLLPRTTLSQAT